MDEVGDPWRERGVARVAEVAASNIGPVIVGAARRDEAQAPGDPRKLVPLLRRVFGPVHLDTPESEMAQAGGKQTDRLDEALAKIVALVEGRAGG